jgi:hypothetical protein
MEPSIITDSTSTTIARAVDPVAEIGRKIMSVLERYES